jgi:outer membrane protein OmpA-like peptidoglycan-associated protein
MRNLLIFFFLLSSFLPARAQLDSSAFYVQLATFPRPMESSYFYGFGEILERRVDSMTYRYFAGPYADSLKGEQVLKKALKQGYKFARKISPEELREMPVFGPEINVLSDALTNPTERLGLPKVKGGVAVSASNVFFGFDSAELDEEAETVLKQVAEVLQDQPGYLLEVRAHTDSKGNELYNILLSEKRSHAVMDYLRDQGIADNRMEPHIFGETTPIARNRAFMGRVMNRRVELVLKDTSRKGDEE